jgi:hypothetical protein
MKPETKPKPEMKPKAETALLEARAAGMGRERWN